MDLYSENTKNSRLPILRIALLFLLLSVSISGTIAQITVNVAVLPPYSPDIEQYADNTRITVLAFDFGNIECSLRLTIKGDNGIELVSLYDYMFQTFTLQDAIPVILSGPDLSEYFDLNHLIVSGIDPAELESQGLPPGNYRICARVYSGGMPLSEDFPVGCGNFFRVNYLQPPMLISPADKSEIENTLTQQIIFSWTPSPGAPVWTSYILKIVEISDPARDPNEAMLSATTPAFFEEEVNGTSFLYGPAQPLLDPGKRYAFQVIASETESKSRFENFGRSEVSSFLFGKESDNILAFPELAEMAGPVLVKPKEAASTWTMPNTFVNGTMQYIFPQDQGTRGFMNNIPLKLRVGYYIVSVNNQKTYLANSISDYRIEMTEYAEVHGKTFAFQSILKTDTLPEILSNLAFCTTSNDGEFTFMFNNPGLGLVAENVNAQRILIGFEPGGVKNGEVIYMPKETIEITTGDLYMYANIIVDNPYYTSPVKEVVTPKGDHADLGVITTKVRSYDLKVNVKADKNYQNQYKADNVESMVVYLLRGYKPGGVPIKEGKGSQPVETGEKLFNMQVIAKDITGNNGIATLRNLVKNNYADPNDRYFLYATALESSDINYTMDAAVLYGYNYPGDGALFANEYAPPEPTPLKELVARPLPPAIRGSVYRYDNQMQPVEGAHVQLFNMSYVVNSVTTGTDGRFSFELPGSKEGDEWALLTTCKGFKYSYVVVPYSLILGKKYVREDILLEPESTITGTVINEKGEGVRVHMRIDDGAYREFQPICQDILLNQGASGSSFNTPSSIPGGVQTVHNTGSSVIMGSAAKNITPGTVYNSGSVSLNTEIKIGVVGNMVETPTCTDPTRFTLYSTSGDHTIIINPVDPQYLPDTVKVNIDKGDNTHPTITLSTRKHRILVRVKELSYSGTPGLAPPVANAKVTVENYETKTTNNLGEATFEYISASDTVRLYVEGPPQADYVPTLKTAYADESKEYKVITVLLRPGGRIRGVVYAGTTDSSSVASARVYADIPGEINIEALSDAKGNYELRNVPLNTKIKLRAVKSASNFVGDSLQVRITKTKSSENGILEGINFHLQVFNDMDISKLLGFPIEVTRLTIGGSGGKEVFISGNFTNIPSNECFSLPASEAVMRFNNVSIIPSPYQQNENGVPLSQPKDNKVTTNKNKLSVSLYNSFKADLIGDQLLGLEVVDISKGTGAIAARVKFDLASFPTSLVSFKETVWLSSGTTGTTKLPAFSTEPGYVNYPNGLYISDETGGPLSFTFDNLTLEANRAGSVINGDTLRLNAMLHTNFKNIPQPDAKLPLGNMVFIKKAAQLVTFSTIYGKDLIIPLSQSSIPWSLNVSNWALSKDSGLQFINGFVNTGIVTIPFSNIYVEQAQDSTMLKGGDYKLDQLSLANLVTLNITGQKQFGYDIGKKAWKLSVSGLPGQPCAWFGGLPGMALGDKVEIENFFFVSNGNPVFNISQTSKPLTLHKVGLFTPGLITVINDDIAIAGMIDYKIPYMNNGNKIDYKIFYFRNPDNSIGFRNEVAAFLITPPGPVTMEFFQIAGSQTLDEKGFHARGKVYEKIGSEKLFEFDAWLYRTTDSTSLIVDRTTNQMFRFSGSSTVSPRLENVWGRTIVSGAGWMPLSFGGDLRNAKGASGALSFTVHGDLVADKQEIQVDNIPGPFSGISNFTYDFANKRFTGIIDFSRTLNGGAYFNASAEVLFDPSGWYFLGLGAISVPSPNMGGDASVFIGDYSVNQYIIDKFVPNSRVYQIFGVPPANFPALNQKFSGFYIEGGVHLPIPIIPQFEFDLGLISAQLTHEIGGDIRMSMNFTEANTYHMGVSIYGRITAGVGTSMGVVCASSTVTGKGLISADGVYSSDGSWSAIGYTEFGISGTTELGVGTCTSSCEGIFGVGPCFVDSAAAGKSLFGKFSISSAGTSFEFGFK